MSQSANLPDGVEPHRATTILILGILSLVLCQPLGIAAWMMGSADLKKMKAGVMDRSLKVKLKPVTSWESSVSSSWRSAC